MKDKDCKCRVVPPPPQGPQGPPGKQGLQGPQGIPGLSDPQSAFRAELINDMPFVGGTTVQVPFPNLVFDLNNEYSPLTSTFTPNQSGVYVINATVHFRATDSNINNSALLTIVLGVQVLSRATNVFVAPFITGENSITTSTVVQLQPGDTVDVLYSNTVDGNLMFDTTFGAARVPSP
ncbi:C1q-like domain-containing protein [Bacillus sp. SCS-151]|uniref:C1q-like domain-containing protein n=1 Tax=Nanhaiella sioensis TaxID=3115293 RepID=UPI00397C248A